MAKLSKKLVTKKTWGKVKKDVWMEVFQDYGQEPLKVRVLDRLAMCQDWNETSDQDCYQMLIILCCDQGANF